jgi:two-component system chemotaxis sensor kinase CheA
MDVVRTNIEKIGGTIEMKSKLGRGSTFVIKIPLTLAIVSALIVESCGERFAIPQISVVELVRASANSEHRIERVHGTPVLRLRNRLLPLVNLERLLQLDNDKEQTASADAFIVVTQVGAYTFGIMVDRVFDTEEIVVKPVAPILRHLSLFSGNTILGDGSVIMILDPNGIATATGEMTAMSDAPVAEQSAAQSVRSDDRVTLLVFRAGQVGPKSVPLSLVARLEEIDLASVEYSNAKPMVQYREKLMPLIPIDPSIVIGSEGAAPVLVFTDGDHSMGLLVDEIVDIVEDRLKVELTSDNPGFMGSAIIAGRATDLIDAGYFLQQAFGDWFQAGGQRQISGQEARKRVLVVDDSAFFRNLLTPLLSVAGYESVAVASAKEALSLLEAGHPFDVVVSDVEMPGINGFEFAQAIRNNSKYADMPIFALSSHSAPVVFERGRAAGFTDYVAKSDRDALIGSLAQALSMSVSERGMA